jgi:hypothetical protein
VDSFKQRRASSWPSKNGIFQTNIIRVLEFFGNGFSNKYLPETPLWNTETQGPEVDLKGIRLSNPSTNRRIGLIKLHQIFGFLTNSSSVYPVKSR